MLSLEKGGDNMVMKTIVQSSQTKQCMKSVLHFVVWQCNVVLGIFVS